jgi:hypothetical protein
MNPLFIFIVSNGPPKPSFKNAFDEITVVSGSNIKLISLGLIVNVFRREYKEIIAIVNFPEEIPKHLNLIYITA